MERFPSTSVLLAVAFVLLWNSGFIGAEYGLEQVEPFTFLFWRYLALSVILALFLASRARLRWPGLKQAGFAAIVGILAHGVWLGCVMFSLQAGVPAAIVALIVALQPMLVGALSGPVLGEHTSPARWLGLVTGFAGVAIVVWERINVHSIASIAAHLMPFGSVIAITVATLMYRWLEIHGRVHRLPLDLTLFYQAGATTLAMAVPAAVFGPFTIDWTPAFTGVMVWLVLGVSLAAYALMWELIARLDATRVSSLFYLGPPVTAVMAWILFGDMPRVSDLLGLAVTAAGVAIVLGARHHPAHSRKGPD